MTKKRPLVDPLLKVTPAYQHMFSRFRTVIARVRDHVTGEPAILDQHDVNELEHVYTTALEIEGQMRRYLKEANTKGG